MHIYDEEDGKTVSINFAPGNRGEVILTMKDGSQHRLPFDIVRTLAHGVIGMASVLENDDEQPRKRKRPRR